jgi:hypothetical protein
MADAFEILQVSLGPALRALEEGGRNRLIMARDMQQQRAREQERKQHQDFVSAERKGHEEFVTRRDEAQRETRKSDEREARLRELQLKVASLGGTVTGSETEKDLAKMLPELEIKHTLQKNMALSEGQLRDKARFLGVDDKGIDLATLARKVSDKEHADKIERSATDFNTQIDMIRKDPKFQAMRKQYGMLQAERQFLMSKLAAPVPEVQPGMTEQDAAVLARMYANNPQSIAAITKLPGGSRLLLAMRNARDGSPNRQLIMALAKNPKLADEVALALKPVADEVNEDLEKGKMVKYSAGIQSYLANIRALSDILQRTDRRIEDLKKTGAKEGQLYGSALEFEDPDILANEYRKDFVTAMPGTTNQEPKLPELPPLPDSPAVPPAAQSAAPTATRSSVVPPPAARPPAESLSVGQWLDRNVWPAPAGQPQRPSAVSNFLDRAINVIAPPAKDAPYVAPYLPLPQDESLYQ